MEPTTYLMLAALGGFVGLDAVSGPQAMISRPIVAGPLAGLLLGVPEAGMQVGAFLEILTLRHLPIGAARQWDTGPAAVVAAASVAMLPPGTASILIAVGAGAVVGRFGSRTVHLMRHFNAQLVAVEGPIAPHQLTLRHLAAMGGDFARAAVLTGIACLFVSVLALGMVAAPQSAEVLAGLLLVIVINLALGSDIRTLAAGRAVWAAFGAGIALSMLVFVWLS